ncbi:MAG: gamma-glutamylcyclotransferase family protein [Sphingomicrobium sp.]
MTEWIFSYGTLRQAEVQRAIFGRELEGHADALTGFRVGMVAISNPEVVRLSGSSEHPRLIRTDDNKDRVEGVALSITADELVAADAYEAADYVRVPVTLTSGRSAFVYVARG